MGEYGGLGLRVVNHVWSLRDCHSYKELSNASTFEHAFEALQEKLFKLSQDRIKGLSASVYTQYTDVETECNGLFTYDRIPKVNVKNIKKMNQRLTSMTNNNNSRDKLPIDQTYAVNLENARKA